MSGNLTPPTPATHIFQATNGVVYGTNLNDELGGGAVLIGGDGDDILYGPASGGALYGGAGRDFLYASSGSTLLDAGDGDNVVYGGDGPDVIVVGVGNNQLYGAGGSNVAVLPELYQQTMISLNGAQSFVNGPAGSNVMYSVPTLRFLDGAYTNDPTSHLGQAYRLYQAAFARTPDAVGLAFWTGALDGGATLTNVANQFVASAEFTGRYGALDDTGFVSALYQNVLGRPAETTGVAYWVNQLNTGVSRAQVLVGLSESAENYANTAPVFAKGLFAPSQNALDVLAAFRTVLGRALDAGSLSAFSNALRGGLRQPDLVASLINSAEFQAQSGGASDADYVQKIVQNAEGGRDDAGAAFWQAELAAGSVNRVDVALAYMRSNQVQAAVAPLIGHI